jgi:hypothetical protein
MSYFKFTRISGNSKTGPIPTTVSSSDTCPDNCGLKKSGCYAEYGMVGMHWRNTDKGKHVITWGELCANVKALPNGQLWRHNVSGDIPSIGVTIDGNSLFELIKANNGKRGFTYTHHVMSKHNQSLVNYANQSGFTINLSADNVTQADELKALGIAPVVCLMPENGPKAITTPAGNLIVQCPATYIDTINCANCGICAVPDRKAIIGFPVHGSGRKKAANVFKGIAVNKG